MAEQSFCRYFLYVPSSKQFLNLFHKFILQWMVKIHNPFCEEESKSETTANWEKSP